MKSLPRLALGVLFAAVLAATTHAVTYSTAAWNGPSGAFYQTWNVTVPSAVNITTSITLTTYASNGGGGGAQVSGPGGSVSAATGHPGIGTSSGSNSAYGRPAGNYTVYHSFGGPPNTVYGNLSSTLTW